MDKPIIKYVKWGIGNTYGNVIELNINLKDNKNRKLHNAILDHEMQHSQSGFHWKDFKEDFISEDPFKKHDVPLKEFFRFIVQNPSSFLQILPFYWKKPYGFVLDPSLTFMWLLILSVLGSIVYLFI